MEKSEFITFARQNFKIVPEDRIQQVWREVKKNPDLGEDKIDLETFTDNFKNLTQIAGDSRKAVQYEVTVEKKPFGVKFTAGGVIYDTTERAQNAGVKPGSKIISVGGTPVTPTTFVKTFSAASTPFPMVLQTLFKYERTVTKKPFGFDFKENTVSGVSSAGLAGIRTEVNGSSEPPVEAGDVISRVGGEKIDSKNFGAVFAKTECPFTITLLTKNQQKVTEQQVGGGDDQKDQPGSEGLQGVTTIQDVLTEGSTSKTAPSESKKQGSVGRGRGRGTKRQGSTGRGRGKAGGGRGRCSAKKKTIKEEYTDRLKEIMPKDKHSGIDALLKKNVRKEHDLYVRVCKKYKKKPKAKYTGKAL